MAFLDNSGVYKIINNITKECYYGSTKNFARRKQQHWKLLTLNKHHSILLQRAVNKYNIKNFSFEIVCHCDVDKLIRFEQKCIDIYRPFYNICKKAKSRQGIKASEHTRQLIRNNKILNYEKTMEQIKNLANKKRGVPLSFEQKNKLSLALKGKKLNYVRTDEQKKQASEKAKKRFFGDKLNEHPNAKLDWDKVREIRVLYTKGFSLNKIASIYNVKKASIWKVVNNYSWIEGDK